MKRFLSGRRYLVRTIALLALAAGSALLLGPRIVRAFTLPPTMIHFDPVSVPAGHTLHVHLMNRFGADPMDFSLILLPTTPGAGSRVVAGPITLNPGDGTDQAFTFAAFAPPAGVMHVPVVAMIMVTANGGGRLVPDWSGTVSSSVEILNDRTHQQTVILGSRHISIDGTFGGSFCLSCN